MTVENLREILLNCERKDSRAQRQLYDLYKVELLQVCRRYAPDESTAKDMFQEGFIRIFKDIHQFNPEKGKFRSWIRKVMVNSALQHIRASKKWKGYLELNGTVTEDLTYCDDALEKLSAEEIHLLIEKMPDGYKLVFNLYILEGFSHKEIAEMMGSSTGTSKSQLFKAKQWLRERLLIMDPSLEKTYGKQAVQG